MKLKETLEDLYKKNIFIGTSSWKYDGWKNLIYFKNYKNNKDFSDNSIQEYSSIFPTVGIDYTYYDWPNKEKLDKYFNETPQNFIFALKVTDKITVFRYPNLKRYAVNAGMFNSSFLNSDLFFEKFIRPIEAYKHKLGPIIFEFSHFEPNMNLSGRNFVERLDVFLQALRNEGDYLFAVEIRNENWLEPLYFETLYKNNVVPVLNSWTKMPPINVQLSKCMRKNFKTLILRALLQNGIKYKDAVRIFYPYNRICHKNEKLRMDIANLIQTAMVNEKKLFIYVNNRLEGSAPRTIEGILEKLAIL